MQWERLKMAGMAPGPRASFNMAVHRQRAVLFGGITDQPGKVRRCCTGNVGPQQHLQEPLKCGLHAIKHAGSKDSNLLGQRFTTHVFVRLPWPYSITARDHVQTG